MTRTYVSSVRFADAMLSFSGFTLVLVCFVFVFCFHSSPDPSSNRSWKYMRHDMIATRSYLTTVCVLFCFCFVSFLSLWRCRFFRVLFVPSPFPLYMESTLDVSPTQWCLKKNLNACKPSFCNRVITGWIFYISLCENSIKQVFFGISLKDDGPQRATVYQFHLLID